MTVKGIIAAGIGFGGVREMPVRGLIAGLAAAGGGAAGGGPIVYLPADNWVEVRPGVWEPRKPVDDDMDLLLMLIL